ncbi:uncharacterized protein LOC131434479 [Malaya genurostris]|uniref:uncharacterized protein LOC131434479 n=1 Tax=Malaya genurostris TaxID=325434 RepID=UPI0026F3DE28|nr:uncharacterized protein LOC131434479 [Malaya genurostris]
MGTDMQELKGRKSSVLERIKKMYAAEGRTEKESTVLEMEGFREKYGITQSPKMRQLLEVTGEWNREILENQQFQERLAQATPITPKDRVKVVPSLDYIIESPEAHQDVMQRSKIELIRREKIDDYRQRMEVHKEYRKLLEDRKKNIISRRPLTKQERDDIRKLYQDAQEMRYTTPTEEELDNALRLSEMMELEEARVSMKDSPDRNVEVLLPETCPTVDITGAVGDVLIPVEIPIEEMVTINSLDRSTAKVALKASLIPAPTDDAATKLLESGIEEITNTSIQPIPQTVDSMYEIDLKLDRPKRQNLIQLQGTSRPSWFPGFYTVFPGPPGLVQATKSPSSTLLTARRKIQPSVAD